MPLNDGTQSRKVRVKQGREYVTKTVRIRPIDPSTLKVTMAEDDPPKADPRKLPGDTPAK